MKIRLRLLGSSRLHDTKKSAQIDYTYNGSPYTLYVPYIRRLVSPMTNSRITLEDSEGNEIDIRQQPGIPYVISAKMLGGKRIQITTENEETYVFEDDEIPDLTKIF